MGCILCRFMDDTKLEDIDDMVASRAAVQRDLYRVEK